MKSTQAFSVEGINIRSLVDQVFKNGTLSEKGCLEERGSVQIASLFDSFRRFLQDFFYRHLITYFDGFVKILSVYSNGNNSQEYNQYRRFHYDVLHFPVNPFKSTRYGSDGSLLLRREISFIMAIH